VRVITTTWGGVEKPVHDDEYLYAFGEDAEHWADREQGRDLMAALIESAHFKSAARAWHRHQASTLPKLQPQEGSSLLYRRLRG
jgi:hypothetical protein